MLRRSLILILFPFFCNGQTSRFADEWKNDKDLKIASFGFCVLDAKTSSLVAACNPQLGLVPASTLKVVTTSAALGLLGAGYRYETRLAYTGTFNKESGVLQGDLVIVGSGDPTLQSENFTKQEPPITETWAKLLAEKGLKRITGKVIGDASCFARGVPDTWIWADIGNYFGAVPCGLSYMDNKFRIVFDTGEPGSPATLKSMDVSYATHSISVTSSVIAKGSEDEAYVYGDPFSYTREIKGMLPPNRKSYDIEAALPDPALLCAEHLQAALQKAGIIAGAAAAARYQRDTSQALHAFFTHYSPTLDRIILYTNLKSNNHYAQSLLLTLGKGNAEAGKEAVKNYWKQRGLATDELFMSDGCGLSRANTVTTNFLAGLLCKMYRDSSGYGVFNRSLPLAGKEGSMSSLGKNTIIENNLRAKTGYINRARGYCGYLKTRSGRDLAFSVLINNYICSPKAAKLKLEKFLVELAEL